MKSESELLDVLEETTKELQTVFEMDITFETEHITEEGVIALRKAQALLLKYGRNTCAPGL